MAEKKNMNGEKTMAGRKAVADEKLTAGRKAAADEKLTAGEKAAADEKAAAGEIDFSNAKYRGRLRQIPIYIGKLFRMFVYQNDWKVIPLAVFIAALVALVVKGTFFVTMEGTTKGALALTSVSLWNGFFNSIQVVCRERNIVKREHRSGLHMSSYIAAHMVYQAFLCIIQTITTVLVFRYSGVQFPKHHLVNGFTLDFILTIFLITYAADMLSLFISSVARSTTAAMTVMPLVLMVQLIFSGCMFSLPGSMKGLSKFMISNHGTACICAEADYNGLKSTSGWSMLNKMAGRPDADPNVKSMVEDMERNGYKEVVEAETAKSNYKEDYVYTAANVKHRWRVLAGFALFFALLSVVSLEFIDKDRR